MFTDAQVDRMIDALVILVVGLGGVGLVMFKACFGAITRKLNRIAVETRGAKTERLETNRIVKRIDAKQEPPRNRRRTDNDDPA